jgi:hypothetical protein
MQMSASWHHVKGTENKKRCWRQIAQSVRCYFQSEKSSMKHLLKGVRPAEHAEAADPKP